MLPPVAAEGILEYESKQKVHQITAHALAKLVGEQVPSLGSSSAKLSICSNMFKTASGLIAGQC